MLNLRKKAMTKEEYLKLAAAKWDSIEKMQEIDNFYDYEKEFDRIWVELGKEVLDGSLGEVSKDRRQKKESKPDMDK
jgi:hypothetical protein